MPLRNCVYKFQSYTHYTVRRRYPIWNSSAVKQDIIIWKFINSGRFYRLPHNKHNFRFRRIDHICMSEQTLLVYGRLKDDKVGILCNHFYRMKWGPQRFNYVYMVEVEYSYTVQAYTQFVQSRSDKGTRSLSKSAWSPQFLFIIYFNLSPFINHALHGVEPNLIAMAC